MENGKALTLNTVRKQKNLEKITAIVMECRNSGLTAREWCERNGYSTSTYYKWQEKVFKVALETGMQFADVTPITRISSEISVMTSDGIRIDVRAADADTIAEVIRGIRNA